MMIKEGDDRSQGGCRLRLHVSALSKPAGSPGARARAPGRSRQFWIDVQGKQTHGAAPWHGIDPIVTGSQIVMGLQTIVSRQSNIALEPAVITDRHIPTGNRMNIVPDAVGDRYRAHLRQARRKTSWRIGTTATNIAESAGTTAKVKVVELYNAVVNPPDLTAQMAPTLQRVAGSGNYGVMPKASASEDFSFYQQEAPGLFFNLGVTPKGPSRPGGPQPLAAFLCGRVGLIYGVRALANLTVDYMLQKQ
jgi:amidohydrolase